jgi:hypothetical protein
VTPAEAVAKAEKQLQVAGANLDEIAAALNADGVCTAADLIANAEARTRLGLAWLDLASARALIP